MTRSMPAAAKAGTNYRLHVDLPAATVSDDAGVSKPFQIDPFRRTCLLEGLDNISLSLKNAADITAWEAGHGLPPVAAAGR